MSEPCLYGHHIGATRLAGKEAELTASAHEQIFLRQLGSKAMGKSQGSVRGKQLEKQTHLPQLVSTRAQRAGEPWWNPWWAPLRAWAGEDGQ